MGIPGAVAARFKTEQTRGDDSDSDEEDSEEKSSPKPLASKKTTITDR